MYEEYYPKVIILLSGKRKSGKDYIAELLSARFNSTSATNCKVLHISSPLKEEYARIHGLDLSQLLSADSYKEMYRKEMVEWGEEIRNKDPGYFCRICVKEGIGFNIWIVADVRRKTDLEWFSSRYGQYCKLLKVRIVACEKVREGRGWKYTVGIDDAETECGLDKGVVWDLEVRNEGQEMEKDLERVVERVEMK